jgi:hypothetical protein
MRFQAVVSFVVSVLLWAASLPGCMTPEPTRQQVVRERGADVMPFDIGKATHIFTQTDSGGTLKVIAKNENDAQQIAMIRAHLKDIATKFGSGDFSGPAHVHGENMPGLSDLRSAKPSELQTQFAEIPSGATVGFFSTQPRIVSALHAWFGAQVADHGSDATVGHDHSMTHQK